MTDADAFDAFEGVIAQLDALVADLERSYRLRATEATGAAIDGLSDLIGDLRQRQAQYEDADCERRVAESRAERAAYERSVV